MKFLAIACLSVLATLATALPSVYRAELHPLFGNSRITNGQNAEPGAYPWQVTIQWVFADSDSTQHVCGGSIINELWIVSAAHCFPDISYIDNYIVLAGRNNLAVKESTEQARPVSQIINHPDYLGGTNPHDFTLLKVSSPFTWTDAVAPIALPLKDTVHSGNAVLSGWGSISTTATVVSPAILQRAILPIQDTQVCYDAFATRIRNPPLDPSTLDNVCAGPLDSSGVSACSGDSGGPLAQQVGRQWELVGVVSWGLFPCGNAGLPSVFVRTSAYIDWINEQIA